jgi:PAS domain S-box-containing protein
MYQEELQNIINTFKGKLPEDEVFKNFLLEVNNSFKKGSNGKIDNPRLKSDDAVLVVENSTDMVALHEPDLTCTYISPSVRETLGYEPDEILGLSAYDYFHHDDIPVISRLHDDLLKSPEKRVTVAYRLRHKQGHYVWVEATAKIILDDVTGEPKKIIAAVRDISKRKEFEQELLEGQIRLELLNAIMEMRDNERPVEEIVKYTLESLKQYFPDFRISYTTLDEKTGIQTLDYLVGFGDEVQQMQGRTLDLNHVPEILAALKGKSPVMLW